MLLDPLSLTIKTNGYGNHPFRNHGASCFLCSGRTCSGTTRQVPMKETVDFYICDLQYSCWLCLLVVLLSISGSVMVPVALKYTCGCSRSYGPVVPVAAGVTRWSLLDLLQNRRDSNPHSSFISLSLTQLSTSTSLRLLYSNHEPCTHSGAYITSTSLHWAIKGPVAHNLYRKDKYYI